MEKNKNQVPNSKDNVEHTIDDSCEEKEIKLVPISEAVKIQREKRDQRNKEYHEKLAKLEAKKKKLYAELDADNKGAKE
ncbi:MULTISPECIES: hypothetical protein [Bacillus cereus group]